MVKPIRILILRFRLASTSTEAASLEIPSNVQGISELYPAKWSLCRARTVAVIKITRSNIHRSPKPIWFYVECQNFILSVKLCGQVEKRT
ncbi:hypothetical protein JAAARDRAFT_528968 [Jaapia argillacea MUCL 33604]|uniref:Secreted protein n=1 Tax=Jaapia argillacea MUCL 33604 TaxID=933084 RepID=A0A067QHD0_9AGAM|nr:hypothetical protein JAAARDRAFT_528968 [Jaapia argillacea MUCL 33604]